MKRGIAALGLALATMLFAAPLTAAEPINPKDYAGKKIEILFIGNSMTYYWNMPTIFQKIAALNKIEINFDKTYRGDQGLQYHWEESKDNDYSKCAKTLLEIPRDIVVLQPWSNGKGKHKTDLETYLPLFVEAARAKNPKVRFVLYWARSVEPTPEDFLLKEYAYFEEAAKKYDAIIVPGMLAWHKVMSEKAPAEQWRMAAGDKHPINKMSFLVANLMYACMFGKNPVGMDFKELPIKDSNNPKEFEKMADDELAYFQKLALEMAQKYSTVKIEGAADTKSAEAKTDAKSGEVKSAEVKSAEVKSDAKTTEVKTTEPAKTK